jgi:hypothetical protein
VDKHQAEIVSDTLLAPAREAQYQETQHQLRKKQRVEAQRRRAAFALAGAIGGALVGYLGTGDVWPAALVGFVLGGLVGFLWRNHV